MTTLRGDRTGLVGAGTPARTWSGPAHPADPPTFDDVAAPPYRTATPRAWLPARHDEAGNGARPGAESGTDTTTGTVTDTGTDTNTGTDTEADREAARARRDRRLATLFCVAALLVVDGTLIAVTGTWTYALLGVLCLTVIVRVLAAVPLARRPRRPGQ